MALLLKLAHFFGVDASQLAHSDRSRLVGDLMELFGDELFCDFELTNHDIGDLAASNPRIGQAMVRLYDRYLAVGKKSGDIPALMGDTSVDIAADAVSDFLQLNLNYFDSLEVAAERIRHDIDLASDSFDYGLKAYLLNAFGLRWRQTKMIDEQSFHIDMEAGDIETGDLLPTESATFIAASYMGQYACADQLDLLLRGASIPEEAVDIARRALVSYFAAALIMPYERFFGACKDTRYDIDRIARMFNASFEQVCHRMTTLQRPGMTGVPMHLVRTDIAGNISKRFSLSGIQIPRHLGACPRWNVYGAFLHPERINVQISQMPDGDLYLCVAKSIAKGGYRYNLPRRHLSVGIGCHISHASALTYSDGIDFSNRRQIVPIGVSCPVCPRENCAQRAHPCAHPRELGSGRRLQEGKM